MRLVKEFIGKEVLSADVEILGKVSDIDWDVDSNQIESLIVSGSGIQNTLKISNGELVIPFDTVDKIGDKVVLKSAFAEDDDGLSNIEKEIQDLKNQL
ncbi:MAG: PRC-barrel domain-containing protein [Methanobrevibacter sp.]|nr:PRC-barrel domain-containing protein [Methanobrevibacter sp.]